MPSNADLLLGKIAVQSKLATQDQIDGCIKEQEKLKPPPSLGQLLLQKKVINPKQLEQLVKIQQERMQTTDPITKKRKEAEIFGKLVISKKLATPEKVNECLRIQAQDPKDPRTLGEVMVAKGYLKPEDVRSILGAQKKRTMKCAKCNLSFTVATTHESSNIKCPKCKGPLTEQSAKAPVKTDAEFGTMIARAVDLQLPAKPAAKPAAPAVSVSVVCVICDNPFEAAPDATGRVRCTKCQSIFTPRKKT